MSSKLVIEKRRTICFSILLVWPGWSSESFAQQMFIQKVVNSRDQLSFVSPWPWKCFPTDTVFSLLEFYSIFYLCFYFRRHATWIMRPQAKKLLQQFNLNSGQILPSLAFAICDAVSKNYAHTWTDRIGASRLAIIKIKSSFIPFQNILFSCFWSWILSCLPLAAHYSGIQLWG